MPDNKYYDKRTMNRYLIDETISKDDVEKHLKAVPDSESEATWVHMDLHDTEFSEEISEEPSTVLE